jgi:hypothetical protein
MPPTPTKTPISLVMLARGVNMGNMLEAPNEGDWGSYVQQEYFDLIKQAGFDFVRLPVNWKAHTTGSRTTVRGMQWNTQMYISVRSRIFSFVLIFVAWNIWIRFYVVIQMKIRSSEKPSLAKVGSGEIHPR